MPASLPLPEIHPEPDRSVTFEIQRATRYLFAQPGVRTVWLFGSVARGSRLDWRSDLDFAIEGLPVCRLGYVWSELDQMLRLPVDVVRMEEAPPALRDEILRHGIRLEAS